MRFRITSKAPSPREMRARELGSGAGAGVMLPLRSEYSGADVVLLRTNSPKILPPVKSTSDPGVIVVVKKRVSASHKQGGPLLLLSTPRKKSDAPLGSANCVLVKEAKPGKVMSTAVRLPLVTSMVSVPENAQVAPLAQEPRIPVESFSAVPETSKVLVVSACA